jgi:hypothetical protein
MSFRLNVDDFVQQLVSYFQGKDWLLSHDKRENFWTVSRDFDGSSVRFVINNKSVLAPTLTPKLRIAPYLTDIAFSKIEKQIFQSKIQAEPPIAYTEIVKAVPELPAAFFSLFAEVAEEVAKWGRSLDLQSCVHELAIKGVPDVGGGQLRHLTALAYLGDFNTLVDYQEMFREGKRMNFVPMITPEMIDRAVNIAAERA